MNRAHQVMTQAFREEHDSLGPVEVPAERLWGAQTQRSLKYFSIGDDRMPKEMITAYAIVKKAAAICNQSSGRLDKEKADLIIDVCNELLAGEPSRGISTVCMDDWQRDAIQHEYE